MKNSQFSAILLILSFLVLTSDGFCQGRQETPFNNDWSFQGQTVSGAKIEKSVTLPHSWNTKDAQEGLVYYRGIGTYQKAFSTEESWEDQRVFIRFDGANITTNVSINETELGEHRGGYGAFVFEITEYLKSGAENILKVVVDNSATLNVIPLVGDFNNYGGIYRPVNLIITNPICITPLDYASPGIYLKQSGVTKQKAEVEVLTKLSNKSGQEENISLVTTIFDADRNIIETQKSDEIVTSENQEATHKYTINNPHLWHGKKDPYLYQVKVELLRGDVVIDSKTEPLGLRFFKIDANEGFFLNDEAIDLRGVSRHQDRKDKASAISQADHRQDMDIMLEMGINALRLAHYQHAEVIYDMTDSAGVVVWAELPWIGMPSGFLATTNGYEDTDEFRSNAKNQLYELIRQNFNHPSILMWSIFNEIQSPEGKEPTEFIKELNAIVKSEDPSRLSVGASMLSPQKHPNIHDITDAIAWNRYYGWYYKMPEDMGAFLDQLHADFPELKVGISEYGAGGSIVQHSDELRPPNPMGSPHPEEWQSYYLEENLKIFDDRPFVWGTFVWNMFDFGSHFRKEGDHHGINDKGLVSYDRKVKKDAFYFHKANWSEEPVLHITSSRYIFRKQIETQVKVYTNLDNVSLSINGKEISSKSPEKGIIIWDNITLEKGNNGVIITAEKGGTTYQDDCTWVIEAPFEGTNLFRQIFDLMMIAHKLAFTCLAIGFLIWLFGIRKAKKGQTFKKIILWTVFTVFTLTGILILLLKYYMSSTMGA